MQRSALRLEHVTRREGASVLLEDIVLTVPEGTLFALVGADGAGKTTLMRTVAGLLKPQVGKVLIGKESLYVGETADPRLQERLGYMPQQFGLYTDLSVAENLNLYADLFGLTGDVRLQRMLELLSVTDLTDFTEREAGSLSGGMKQKLGLACALLNRPRILLLDEPSVGVDPLSRRELWEILRTSVKRERMTVVVSTTYMDEAEKADFVCILENGKVLLTERPETIASLAEGRVFAVESASTMGLRELETRLYDATDLVLDAVPQGGSIRVLLKRTGMRQEAESRFPGTRWKPIASDLEAGYLVKKGSEGLLPERFVPKGSTRPGHEVLEEHVIEARNLVRRFGGFIAVDHTSFDVRAGEIFGLLGPNGAGKTTTFKMLCGLIGVTEGSLRVAGLDIRESREATRRRLGYMSQRFSLYGDLTVLENLRFFGLAYGLMPSVLKSRIAELLEEYDLDRYRERPAKTLPGGVKQRLAMAVSLVHRPEILFLDEPTSGADVPTRRQFWRRIAELARTGTSIVVTTHFMQEALYCDRLMIQDGGRELFLGTPQTLQGDAASVDDAFIDIVLKARRAKETGGSS